MNEAGPYALVATALRAVRSAATLAEALERWPASASAVLISDLGLPVEAERFERVLDEARRERDARRSP